MGVHLGLVEFTLLFERAHDRVHDVGGLDACEFAEAFRDYAFVVYRAYYGDTELLAELEVLRAASGRDVYDARSFRSVHVLPRNYLMRELLTLEIFETGAVFFTDKLLSLERLADFDDIAFELTERVFTDDKRRSIALDLNANVFDLGIYCERAVRRKRPRSGRPEDYFVVGTYYRQFREYRKVLHIRVGPAHFVIGKARSASRAPGHRTVRAHQPAALVADLQKMPYRSDIEVGIREIGMLPVHPLTEAFALLGDYAREFLYAVHTLRGEFVDSVLYDVAFNLYAEILLGFHFHPQALRIEAVLILAGFAEHGVVTDIHILHSPAPGVVNTHGVIRGDRTVEETEAFAVLILFDELVEATVVFPEFEHRFFDSYKIGFAVLFLHKK